MTTTEDRLWHSADVDAWGAASVLAQLCRLGVVTNPVAIKAARDFDHAAALIDEFKKAQQ